MRPLTGARVALGSLGVGLAALTAPVAMADPAVPAEPIVSASAAPADTTSAVVPVAAPAATPAPATVTPAPGAPATVAAAPATAAAVTPPDGVSHLPSPDSLPPGTTSVAQTTQDHPTLGYLKDVWNAVRGKEVSPSDALILLAQRPVDNSKIATSVPQQQSAPAPAPADVPAPAPAAPAPAPVPIPVSAEVPPAG